MATGTSQTGQVAGRPRSNPWRIAFVVLLIVGMLTVVVWILLGSRLLVLREVDVSGTQRSTDEDVLAAVGVETGTPLIRIDTTAVTERVEDLRLVETAEVARGWPATLTVSVAEREPVLSVRAEDGYQLVDHAGVWIEDATELPPDQPLVQVRGEVHGNPAIADAAMIRSQLPADLLEQLVEIDADDPESIALQLENGAKVHWGDVERSADKAEVLEILVRQHPPAEDLSYDVSSPDVVAVR
ncbi:FtsQ-type POTRA domain-containing protein [Lipingzhangella sp. LS1_29]|uniref:FtsQ-type POTRA domain-containing protein n=1 Tax=Lipingzhangella rawalii TaxID=2055835 RepID=A0ABU2H271_9ACTN|nr:FtsQ-type POTRA domain-containing protein [Lipingzhangella rawalii]MDS1269396.1 FtsQ-type POTRA domain-containing protein [Lipingzhangella rawalii]